VRAPDRAVFDNLAPTTRLLRPFSAAGPPGRSRSLVRACIKELEAAGAAFLSPPPLFFRWRGRCSFPRGLFAHIGPGMADFLAKPAWRI
jgi:hypothetical protein